MTKNLNVAKSFSDEKGMIFEVECVSGKDISSVSNYMAEEQVILKPQTCFEVIDC